MSKTQDDADSRLWVCDCLYLKASKKKWGWELKRAEQYAQVLYNAAWLTNTKTNHWPYNIIMILQIKCQKMLTAHSVQEKVETLKQRRGSNLDTSWRRSPTIYFGKIACCHIKNQQSSLRSQFLVFSGFWNSNLSVAFHFRRHFLVWKKVTVNHDVPLPAWPSEHSPDVTLSSRCISLFSDMFPWKLLSECFSLFPYGINQVWEASRNPEFLFLLRCICTCNCTCQCIFL